MKIADITMGKAVLENLADKKRLQKEAVSQNELSNSIKNDVFNSDKTMTMDIAKINELQKSFMKDSLSMSGLKELQNKVEKFELSSVTDRNYEELSMDLNKTVLSTKFEGESIISYLSTQIRDEKSLYTFKTNLGNEISELKNKIADERKNLASYLVKSENLEVERDFSSEKIAEQIASAINKNNMGSIFKGISNINNLLGIEK